MAHRVLHDPEADGWERSDFPIVCETCLGPNPYVRMQRLDYGAECHISKRPYTKFRWRPGSDARYKGTIICQEVAKAKNVCQVCLLDLSHNLPVQVRDQLTSAVVEDIPESQVGLEYQLALKESRGELGKQYKDGEETNESLNRLSRTQPYYKRNRAQVCTFFLRGECKRGAECPYRHEMPEGDGELAHQNIRDRYYGVNDPVARKMLRRLGERPHLEPPEDQTITTLYVGNIERHWTEDDLRNVFKKYGDLSRVKLVPNKSCAFVTYATRKEAELAAEKLHDALIINSVRCKLLWGKPQAQAQNSMAPSGGAVAGSEAAGPSEPYGQPLIAPDGALMPPPRFFGQQANYPSMDPSQMGSAPKGPEGGPAGAGGPSMAPGMRPPGGPPMPHMMQGGMNMPPPGMIPQQWQFMHPAGPMGARPPMGGMHAMRPPQPGMIPPMSMGGMAPHPAAQSGFGMTAPVKMGAAPKPRGPAPAPKPAAPPVSAPSAAAATEVQPQGAPAPDPVPAVESSAS